MNKPLNNSIMTTKTFKSKERGLRKSWLETADGWCIYPEQDGWYPLYNHRFNMDTLEETEDITCPTYNALINSGALVRRVCYGDDYNYYDEFLLDCDVYRRMSESNQKEYTEKLIRNVQAYFEQQGFKVTEDAILHNFTAWSADLKSGYRDVDNGYHLFTPCGCNMLRFSLTRLHPFCNSWQVTYAN